MMEALDQQQAKLTSNRDDGEAGTGSETGSGAGTGGGAAAGEEDDIEELYYVLDLAKEESESHQHGENNNAKKNEDGKPKKNDDVIDVTMTNGQGFRDTPEEETTRTEETAETEETEQAEESLLNLRKSTDTPVDLGANCLTIASPSNDLVKQELVEDKSEELKEPASIPLNEQLIDDIELKTEVEDKSDSSHMEFLTDSEEQPSESLGANHKSEIKEKVDHFQPKESDSNEVEEKYFRSANEDSESEIEETVYTPPVINLETDSESGDKEFISIKDNESPVFEIEGGTEKSQSSKDLYKADVGEYVSTAEPEVVETASQPTGVPSLEGSDTLDSPSLTMDVDLPCSEDGAPPNVIKIESDLEDESHSDSVKLKEHTVEVVPLIKLNGAHKALKEEKLVDEEVEDPGQELKDPKEQSVITNHTGNNTKEEDPTASQVSALSLILPVGTTRSRSISSRSSTVSSASQPHLVIDHPESEHNAKPPALKLSLKRRRSKSSSVSQPEKQTKVESSGSVPSLLLQRLQSNSNVIPPVTSTESQQVLSCAKCNLQFDFERFQELNKHQAQCRGIQSTNSSQLSQKQERFFRCSQCCSVHQCWHFFLHMREVHRRYICLYCNHVYPSVEKLSLHLENKHDIDQSHFAKDAWDQQQSKEDRARHLVCCTCQATFVQGSEFEDHDCSQLMQPCALCNRKGDHIIGCKNNKRKPLKRRRKVRRPPEPPLPVPQEAVEQPVPVEAIPEQLPQQLQLQSDIQNLFPAENIPAPEPVEDPPAPPIPKLVVPKIMLRVPKEFQKSVDAALSSTDTEDEELEPAQPVEEAVSAPPEELPFDAPPPPPPALSYDDSTSSKLNRVLAELERTKLDIERTKADIITKKQSKVIMANAHLENVVPQVADPPQHLQPQQEEQRRWSLTPPASPHNNHVNLPEPPPALITEFQDKPDAMRRNSLGSDCMDMDDSLNAPEMEDSRDLTEEQKETLEPASPSQETQTADEPLAIQPLPPADGIMVAGPDTHTVDLQLDRPLDRFSMVDFVRLCLKSVYSLCLYCNHARRIAVNVKQLVIHLIGQHRFTATVDSITAEELYAETIVAKLKSFLPNLENEYMNAASCCSLENGKYVEQFNERIYECFTCRFVTSTHKELYTHNRRLHIKSNITCVMCQTNFYSYSEILCHICPGEVAGSVYDLQFRCCLCDMAPLPSAFRLMVHLRKQHQACDICLEDCQSQSKLSSHVWKHKLLHLCYRCGIAYRNKQDISKHLFWKHGTESAGCKQCLQKRWRHVYHFCVPPAEFPCEQCGFVFSKAIYLEVHQRMHTGDFRYACTEEGCEEKFVSRKLLLKHASSHVAKELPQEASVEQATDAASPQKLEDIKEELEEGEDKKEGAHNEENLLPESLTNNETPKKEESDRIDNSIEPPLSKSENRKRRKKSKRNKESLEDLNLIAPNLSESDSSDDSDSDAPRSSQQEQPKLPMRSSVDDLDMPKVMLSPSSESDADELDVKSKLEDKEKPSDDSNEEKALDADDELEPKKEEDQVDVSIWKNLLQNQAVAIPEEQAVKDEEKEDLLANLPPAKLHVAWSDHDYCKLYRTPAPSPVKQKSANKSSIKTPGENASSDSDSSSSSSSSDSDSSSCSCGSNCSCSSSNSSSTSGNSDDSDSSTARGSPQKRSRKKSLKVKKSSESLKNDQNGQNEQDQVEDTTAVNENNSPVAPPSPKPPMYNESDFDTAFSDTDEEFYDSHPQKLANELLTQKREALMAEHAPLRPSNNYDIVENSRPSTPSLPEEASAFADKRERVRNKKKKRERKSTCKSGKLQPVASNATPPMDRLPGMPGMIAPLEPPTPILSHPESSLFPVTPLTHRQLQSSITRMSEGSSCSDADAQLKRSKRQRRPNKFYGYTSDDENMSAVLAPPLQVGMQLIKPQPPPQLTWAKEDLPTPPKQRNRNNNNSSHHHHSHSNGGTSSAGSSRKRSKQRSLFGAGGSRPAKRHKPDPEDHLPPIPTLKIRPSLLPTTAPPSDSSESSSDDEEAEVNVTREFL
ncbi:GM21799 [Drosophila sechellia]|uniref:GM21799 n=1 Tax=Drosophila sechellia TaxID=7238 RepID=B4HMW5_DROSE|nr:GM21799 [Drosophila sechellia]